MNSPPEENESGLLERERRFLARIAQKYEAVEDKGAVRSFLIAAAVILALFAAARWVPWWPVALLIAEGAGIYVFYQYKKFTRFKTRILIKLWKLHERAAAEG